MSARGDIFIDVDQRLTQVAMSESYERMPAGDPAKFPSLQVFDEGEEEVEGETGASMMQTRFTVRGFVEGGSGAEAHDKLLDLHADAVFALCGDGGDLAGTVQIIEPTGRLVVGVRDLASKRSLVFAQPIAVTYPIVRGNPAVRA